MELTLLLLRRRDGLDLAKWSFKLIGDLVLFLGTKRGC